MNNIETSFRQIRLFALVYICLSALVTGFAVWNSYSFAEKQRQMNTSAKSRICRKLVSILFNDLNSISLKNLMLFI